MPERQDHASCALAALAARKAESAASIVTRWSSVRSSKGSRGTAAIWIETGVELGAANVSDRPIR